MKLGTLCILSVLPLLAATVGAQTSPKPAIAGANTTPKPASTAFKPPAVASAVNPKITSGTQGQCSCDAVLKFLKDHVVGSPSLILTGAAVTGLVPSGFGAGFQTVDYPVKRRANAQTEAYEGNPSILYFGTKPTNTNRVVSFAKTSGAYSLTVTDKDALGKTVVYNSGTTITCGANSTYVWASGSLATTVQSGDTEWFPITVRFYIVSTEIT